MNPSEQLPALLGGEPGRPQGPPAWPVADEDVLHVLQEAYHNRSWGKYQGTYLEELETQLRRYFQTDFVLPCASGTFAVELALRALQIGPGAEVILAAYDYSGNFLNVHAVGAHPVLVDVHPENWNLNLANVTQAIGPATRALIVSHLHGGAVPMREIMALAQARKLAVIEDAAQAPGAIIQGRKAGTWGDVGILSFGGSKLLSAGRGGALLTGQAAICQRARRYLNRGNHVCPLSELQAAVLLPQLAKLDARNSRRQTNVALLFELLRGIPGLKPFANSLADTHPWYYKLGFQYDAKQFGLDRDLFLKAVRTEGIAVDAGFDGLHIARSPNRFRRVADLAEASKAHLGTVILHHPVLLEGEDEMGEIANAIRKVQDYAEQLRAHTGA